jgi:aldehyde dehydrogenase (NAD+)
VTCLYRVDGFDQALALANDSEFGLTAAIHTRSIHRVEQFRERCRAGVISINGPTYGSEPHMPFGGVKQSGNGTREPGTEALDIYSYLKDVYITTDPAQL